MKKKDQITEKIEQLEKTEKSAEKKNKVDYGPGRRGVTVGVTLGLCAVLMVGGYFLVKTMIDNSTLDQTSNAPVQSYDSGVFTAGTASDTADTGISYPSGSNAQPDESTSASQAHTTTTRDSGAMTDSGAGADPVETDPGRDPDNGGVSVPGGDDIVIGGIGGDTPDITLPTGGGYDVTVPSNTNSPSGVDPTDPADPVIPATDPVVPPATSASTARTTATPATGATTAATSASSTTGGGSSSTTSSSSRSSDVVYIDITTTVGRPLSDFFN